MSGPLQLDSIKDALDEINNRQRAVLLRVNDVVVRLSRTETRICRLLEHHGLDESGQPKPTMTGKPDA